MPKNIDQVGLIIRSCGVLESWDKKNPILIERSNLNIKNLFLDGFVSNLILRIQIKLIREFFFVMFEIIKGSFLILESLVIIIRRILMPKASIVPNY